MFSISRREFLLSFGIFVGLVVITVPLIGAIRQYQENRYITYEQSLKATNGEELAYAIKTNVGNILAFGDVVSLDKKTMPEIRGEYSAIKKTEEHYNLHYRTESYSCGKSTCTRQVPYYSWDYYKDTYLKSERYTVLGSVVSNLCDTRLSRVNLKDWYIGNINHDSYYSYPSLNVRLYYEQSPIKHTGSVFLRAFSDKITDPMGGTCLSFYDGENINQVLEDVQPNMGLWIWVFFGLIIAILSGYFYYAYEEDIC